MRVAQTGVQVLFGFLLTVPFTLRFDDITANERAVYFVTLMLAGLAAMLLIAATSHPLLFRCGDKERLVMVANRYAIAGLVAVAGAMVGAVLLVSLLVVGRPRRGSCGRGGRGRMRVVLVSGTAAPTARTHARPVLVGRRGGQFARALRSAPRRPLPSAELPSPC